MCPWGWVGFRRRLEHGSVGGEQVQRSLGHSAGAGV